MADQRNKGNRMNRLKYSLAIIAIVAADVILILNIPSDVWDFISKFFEIMSAPNKFVEKCSAQSAAECVASLLGNPERIEAIDQSQDCWPLLFLCAHGSESKMQENLTGLCCSCLFRFST